MKLRKEFKTITQAYDFVSNSFHFKYEHVYIELCMEGNVYENSSRHPMRYFLNIDHSKSLTSQRLKQISMSNKVVDSLLPSSSVALLNPVCRPLFNGAKCTNCEMQDNTNKGSYYQPRTNEDECKKQICLRLNMCPINNMGTRKVNLTQFHDLIGLQWLRHKRFGYCGVNCNLHHNLHSTISMLALNLRSSLHDTTHWPLQNYEKDHEANVRGVKCGCGREWSCNMKLHSLKSCAWMSRSSDVIYSDYEEDANHGLNVTQSYCELVVRTMCRCILSWSLLKHGQLANRTTSVFGHRQTAQCDLSRGSYKNYCGSCVHYCGIQHGC